MSISSLFLEPIKVETNQRIYVYALHKNYVTSADKSKTGRLEINYKAFDRRQSGWYGPKEYGNRQYTREANFYYIETKKPAVHETVDKMDAKYGDALHRITLHEGNAQELITDYDVRQEFFERLDELQSSISSDHADHMRIRKKTRLLSDEGFEFARAKESKLIREFIAGDIVGRGGWVDRLQESYNIDEHQARKFLLYNMSKPYAVGGFYTEVEMGPVGNRINLPYYKMNKRFNDAVLRYYVDFGENFGNKAKGVDLVREYISNWENTVNGIDVNTSKFVTGTRNLYHKDYNLNNIKNGDSYLQSLLGPGFASPYLDYKLRRAGAEYVRRSVMKSGDKTRKSLIRTPRSPRRRSKVDC